MTQKIKTYSLKDIAELSGVSIATLSRYFNGQNVRESTKKKINTVLDKTHYTPNVAARYMKGHNTGIIGLILPELTHYFFSAIAEGVLEEARKNNFTVLLGSSQGSQQIERQIIHQFSHSILDGLIYIPVAQAEDIPTLKHFRNLPLVIAARHSIFPNTPHIYHDGVKGGYLATQYLIKLNRKRIAFIPSFWNAPCMTSRDLIDFLSDKRSGSFSSCDRLKGYIEALKEAHIPIDPDLIITSTYSRQSGINTASKLLGKMKSCNGAILMDQIIASGFVSQMEQQGVSIPQDISLIIFDDSSRNSIYPYSKIDLQLKKMGTESLKTLQKLIDGKSAKDICLDVLLSPDRTTSLLKD